jgi:hypothetical protein
MRFHIAIIISAACAPLFAESSTNEQSLLVPPFYYGEIVTTASLTLGYPDLIYGSGGIGYNFSNVGNSESAKINGVIATAGIGENTCRLGLGYMYGYWTMVGPIYATMKGSYLYEHGDSNRFDKGDGYGVEIDINAMAANAQLGWYPGDDGDLFSFGIGMGF